MFISIILSFLNYDEILSRVNADEILIYSIYIVLRWRESLAKNKSRTKRDSANDSKSCDVRKTSQYLYGKYERKKA